MNKKSVVIKCPHCGCEYLPAEIFYPEEFLGQPKNILKDDNGKILGFQGEDMALVESFFCDHCGKEFKVTATCSFKSEAVKDIFDDADDFEIKE